jgi:hypothetical protein
VCGVAECDCEASIMRRTWPTRGCCATERIMAACLVPYIENCVSVRRRVLSERKHVVELTTRPPFYAFIL